MYERKQQATSNHQATTTPPPQGKNAGSSRLGKGKKTHTNTHARFCGWCDIMGLERWKGKWKE